MRDQDAADRRGMFQPAGKIDRITDGGVLTDRADRSKQGRTGVDPDPQMDVLSLGLLVERGTVELPLPVPDLSLNLQPSADGALRVVFAGGGCAEDRHDRVADVFVNASAVIVDRLVHARPERVDHAADDLMIHGLGERGESRDVREQDGDQFAFLGFVRAAAFRSQVCQFFPNGCNGSIHHFISKPCSLRLESKQGAFEVFAFA